MSVGIGPPHREPSWPWQVPEVIRPPTDLFNYGLQGTPAPGRRLGAREQVWGGGAVQEGPLTRLCQWSFAVL